MRKKNKKNKRRKEETEYQIQIDKTKKNIKSKEN